MNTATSKATHSNLRADAAEWLGLASIRLNAGDLAGAKSAIRMALDIAVKGAAVKATKATAKNAQWCEDVATYAAPSLLMGPATMREIVALA